MPTVLILVHIYFIIKLQNNQTLNFLTYEFTSKIRGATNRKTVRFVVSEATGIKENLNQHLKKHNSSQVKETM